MKLAEAYRASSVCIRRARVEEVSTLEALHEEAVRGLGTAFYRPEQLEAYLEHVGTWDRRMVEAGTYFVAEEDGERAGCGGWSDRGPGYGDAVSGELRLPGRDPAVMRSFYVRPESAGRGIARALVSAAEADAAAHGFRSAELMSSLTALSLYRRCGYREGRRITHILPGGIRVETVHMHKRVLAPPPRG